MNTRLQNIIRLIESSGQPFYEHIFNQDNSYKIEVYWINNQWTIRTTPYQGEWEYPNELLHYKNLNLNHLEEHLSNQLLLEYSYCKLNNIESSELRLKQIHKIFGNEQCYQAICDLKIFKEAMMKAIEKFVPSKTND